MTPRWLDDIKWRECLRIPKRMKKAYIKNSRADIPILIRHLEAALEVVEASKGFKQCQSQSCDFSCKSAHRKLLWDTLARYEAALEVLEAAKTIADEWLKWPHSPVGFYPKDYDYIKNSAPDSLIATLARHEALEAEGRK